MISATNVSKRYRIGSRQETYGSLRESISRTFRTPLSRLRRIGRDPETVWALKDINFEIGIGEVVGLIGDNGAGKSTLLKILSRITEPTTGRAEIFGRVGSLLEVGTGFHPELTGRENVFLNGAVLGMKRTEIAAKFDEIVAFAEIDRFLDTPVKHYSSGMYMRLAFAVAAHLEPEVLLVDEVLAVGDKQFQAKCLGKIKAVAGHGRTVVFVSHNMQAVRQLCSRALWLRSGSILADGNVFDVTEKYLQETPHAKSSLDITNLLRQLPPDPTFRWQGIALTQNGKLAERFLNGRPLEITVGYEVLQRTSGMRVFFDLFDSDGILLFRSFHDEDNDGIPIMEAGVYSSKATIPADLLAPTEYELRVYSTVYNVRMCVPEQGIAIRLKVEATGKANRAYVGDPIRGRLAPSISWTTIPAEETVVADVSAG
jgi:lipopolysaccharide transport system ATP-binding protein